MKIKQILSGFLTLSMVNGGRVRRFDPTLILDQVTGRIASKTVSEMLGSSSNGKIKMSYCSSMEAYLSNPYLYSYDCTSLINESEAEGKNQLLYSSKMGISNLGRSLKGTIIGSDILENVHVYNLYAFHPFTDLIEASLDQNVKNSTLIDYKQELKSWKKVRQLLVNYYDMHSNINLNKIVELLEYAKELKIIKTYDWERKNISYFRYSIHIVVGGCKYGRSLECMNIDDKK